MELPSLPYITPYGKNTPYQYHYAPRNNKDGFSYPVGKNKPIPRRLISRWVVQNEHFRIGENERPPFFNHVITNPLAMSGIDARVSFITYGDLYYIVGILEISQSDDLFL
jgi:hypothetical protein